MKMAEYTVRIYCIVAMIAVLFPGTLLADATSQQVPAIDGYSPVSYFAEDKAEMGQARFSAKHKGKLYWFTSADQVDTFNSDPEQYLPIFDAFCPYSLALGRQTPIDPTNFKIIAGQLLLFHRSEEFDALEAWNNADDDLELLRRAKSTFLSIEF